MKCSFCDLGLVCITDNHGDDYSCCLCNNFTTISGMDKIDDNGCEMFDETSTEKYDDYIYCNYCKIIFKLGNVIHETEDGKDYFHVRMVKKYLYEGNFVEAVPKFKSLDEAKEKIRSNEIVIVWD